MKKYFVNTPVASMLKLAQDLFTVNAVVWLAFAVLGIFRGAVTGDSLRWIYSGLMVVNAMVMFWFGIQVVRGSARTISLAILYMAVNVVLSITDQFGWVDLGILLLNLIILGLLFLARQRMKNTNAG